MCVDALFSNPLVSRIRIVKGLKGYKLIMYLFLNTPFFLRKFTCSILIQDKNRLHSTRHLYITHQETALRTDRHIDIQTDRHTDIPF